ncbi:hypothetical protein E6Q11_00410 [Candidatus Dojkabacteria bacterium]|uniref:Uncharacterized protein n=1 Tax=Candidatus Dojkabacteria bacterium TaxID=2099670 RepID=A0A5C7JDV8_9BACT|nr:MAG: hypothetical protein E6Q11_00410 [Candidatus Dojkabacteria bacterium]
MAAIPAFITLTWISNYAGQHRVCGRVQGSGGPYTCTTALTPHPNCPGGGSPCAYQIPITVDNETCDTVTYEGYVQPTCEDESSLANRTPFVVSFIPSPACKRWELLCASGSVNTLLLTGAGSGYNPLSPPLVTIGGGGGVGATASAQVGQGLIQFLAIGNAGAGYTDGAYVNVPLIGGSGSAGTADITIVGGIITIIAVNNAGTGYQDTDVLAPDTAFVGVPGTPAQLNPTTDYGTITGLTLITAGSGFTAVPAVVIAPSAGVTATASATLTDCPSQFGMKCPNVVTAVQYAPVAVGDLIALCAENAPVAPAPYTVTESGNCLCDCTTVQVSVVGGTVDVIWQDCIKKEMGGPTKIFPDSPLNFCAVNGSWELQNNTGIVSINILGACTGE